MSIIVCNSQDFIGHVIEIRCKQGEFFSCRGKMPTRENLSDQLFQAYKIAAKVVADHGDKYLPVFERLHQEIKAEQARSERMMLALKMSSQQLPKCP